MMNDDVTYNAETLSIHTAILQGLPIAKHTESSHTHTQCINTNISTAFNTLNMPFDEVRTTHSTSFSNSAKVNNAQRLHETEQK